MLCLFLLWSQNVAFAAVMPLKYHPAEKGHLVDFMMMSRIDNTTEVRYEHLSNMQNRLPGSKRNFRSSKTRKHVLHLNTLRNVEYSCEFRLGNGNKVFNLLTDTGSSAMWVPGCDCTTCYDHTCYAPTAADIARTKERLEVTALPTFQISYGSGDVNGNMICTKIHIPSSTNGNDTSIEHCFGLTKHSGLERFYQHSTMDGVLGLSFEQLSSNPGAIFMKDFVDQSHLQYIFAFYFAPAADDGPTDSDSRIFLGEANTACADGNITYFNVTRAMWWETRATMTLHHPSAQPGQGGINMLDWLKTAFRARTTADNDAGPQDVIFDSGTSMMCLPEHIVSRLNTEMKDMLAVNNTMHQSQLETMLDEHLSTLHIQMGATTYTLKGSELVACAEGSTGKEMQCTINADSAKECCSEEANGCNIMGMPFFRRHYVVFDMKNSQGVGAQIGIAKAKHHHAQCTGAATRAQFSQHAPGPSNVANAETSIAFKSGPKEDLIGWTHHKQIGAIQAESKPVKALDSPADNEVDKREPVSMMLHRHVGTLGVDAQLRVHKSHESAE